MSAGVMAAHYVATSGGGFVDPRSISGLVLWLSAQAETGFADGAQMGTWTDRSGLGNHATGVVGGLGVKPLWEATAGPTAGPAVKFQSTSTGTDGGYFTLPNLLSGATSGEALVSVKSTVSRTSLWKVATSGDSSHYPFDTPVYENFGHASGRYSYTPTMAITSWRRYGTYAATNDGKAFLDGVEQASTVAMTVGWPTVPQIGRDAYGFGGSIGAVIIYNRKLTTTERADLDTWLAANPSGGLP